MHFYKKALRSLTIIKMLFFMTFTALLTALSMNCLAHGHDLQHEHHKHHDHHDHQKQSLTRPVLDNRWWLARRRSTALVPPLCRRMDSKNTLVVERVPVAMSVPSMHHRPSFSMLLKKSWWTCPWWSWSSWWSWCSSSTPPTNKVDANQACCVVSSTVTSSP